MDQKPIPRDPHADNAFIDDQVDLATGGQSGTEGGRLAVEIGAADDENTATGGDPQAVRPHGGDKRQPHSDTPGGTIGE